MCIYHYYFIRRVGKLPRGCIAAAVSVDYESFGIAYCAIQTGDDRSRLYRRLLLLFLWHARRFQTAINHDSVYKRRNAVIIILLLLNTDLSCTSIYACLPRACAAYSDVLYILLYCASAATERFAFENVIV